MPDYLTAACRRLGIEADQVLVHRIEAEVLVLVADLGIAGGKKYRFPIAQLAPEERESPRIARSAAPKPRTKRPPHTAPDPSNRQQTTGPAPAAPTKPRRKPAPSKPEEV